MKNQILLLSTVIALFFIASCKNNHESLKADDEKKLKELYSNIQKMPGEFNCDNANDWKFTAIGAKACGGPTGFIPYSIKMDTAVFLQKVRSYTAQQDAFNKRWNISSDCMAVLPPKGVACEDGKPKFFY
jgi:outer membrane protein assembly factor BamD (BamD/ComL family)